MGTGAEAAWMALAVCKPPLPWISFLPAQLSRENEGNLPMAVGGPGSAVGTPDIHRQPKGNWQLEQVLY